MNCAANLNVATWNVEGLTDDKLFCIIRCMLHRNIDIVRITEIHVEACQQHILDFDFSIILSGDNSDHILIQALGLSLIQRFVIASTDSLYSLIELQRSRSNIRFGHLAIICAYAPYNGYPIDTRSC